MQHTLSRYATPLITGLFLVSLISGVALFFHWGSAWFHGMHEWLSMLLILPFGLHVWKNWRSLLNYLGKPALTISMSASLAAALFFVFMSAGGGERGGPPQFALAHSVMQNTPATVAPLFGYSESGLIDRLKAAGFTAASGSLSLSEIANQSGKSEAQIAQLLTAEKS